MSDMQKDLVLSINEYAFVLDKTKGNVACWVGPTKTSLSTSDELVRFDANRKKFIPCGYSEAISLFATAPEGWYIVLKNPTEDGRHPTAGTANNLPDKILVGCKVNLRGPTTFALYPGQMAKVIKGHTLRSNQYLLARVYDAEKANMHDGEVLDGDGNKVDMKTNYVNGQILVIKGTDVSFYIPPTGIEVIAIHNDDNRGYVRDAVTLERLEYCILKDEDGNKRYLHGPEVVFPEPTESFVVDSNNSVKYRAIELSEICGVYVKVIADYKDEHGVEHKTGEELFITGKEQMIYYPRPEHSFITYNGQVRHHAIAIPKGEGRYIMNRMTGEIKTITGPAMYLPDPRTEVVVRRVLSRSQCELWYPGNKEVLAANGYPSMENCGWPAGEKNISYRSMPSASAMSDLEITCLNSVMADDYSGMRTTTKSNVTAITDGSGISRENKFTPPRSITFKDNKYDGAVAVDVWTGYAVNVISKDGTRHVVRGPQTILLDYDQTFEMLALSTGKPKSTDHLERTVFLRHENNRVSDVIYAETSDFVGVSFKVSYLVNFDTSKMDKWFCVDNYVKHLCDWARSAIKEHIRKHSITDLSSDYHTIIREALNQNCECSEGSTCKGLHEFDENGMYLADVEILKFEMDGNIQDMIDDHQQRVISRTLELNAAQQSAAVEKNIIALNQEKVRLNSEFNQFKLAKKAQDDEAALLIDIEYRKMQDEEEQRRVAMAKELQVIKDAIADAERERKAKDLAQQREHQEAMAKIEAEREKRAADAMSQIITAIGPDLAAAMNSANNQEIMSAISGAIAPFAIANGESVSEAVNRLVRGSALEDLMSHIKDVNI